jgi:hypothetical protein
MGRQTGVINLWEAFLFSFEKQSRRGWFLRCYSRLAAD